MKSTKTMNEAPVHGIGLKQERVVIEGPAVKKLKDQILKLADKHDPENKLDFYPATGKIVGPMAKVKIEFLVRDLKGLDKSIKLSIKPQALKKEAYTKDKTPKFSVKDFVNDFIENVKKGYISKYMLSDKKQLIIAIDEMSDMVYGIGDLGKMHKAEFKEIVKQLVKHYNIKEAVDVPNYHRQMEDDMDESKINEDLGLLDGFNLAAGSMLFNLAVAGGILALGGIGVGVAALKNKVDDIIADRQRIKGAKEAQNFMAGNATIKKLQDIVGEVAAAEKAKNDKRAKSKKDEYVKAYKDIVAKRKTIAKELADDIKAAGLSRAAIDYLGEQIPYIRQSGYFKESVNINESKLEIDMRRWWDANPNDLLTYVYWRAGKIPPTNLQKRLIALADIVKQLNTRYPAPASAKASITKMRLALEGETNENSTINEAADDAKAWQAKMMSTLKGKKLGHLPVKDIKKFYDSGVEFSVETVSKPTLTLNFLLRMDTYSNGNKEVVIDISSPNKRGVTQKKVTGNNTAPEMVWKRVETYFLGNK